VLPMPAPLGLLRSNAHRRTHPHLHAEDRKVAEAFQSLRNGHGGVNMRVHGRA
jgi:hypothetical protein